MAGVSTALVGRNLTSRPATIIFCRQPLLVIRDHAPLNTLAIPQRTTSQTSRTQATMAHLQRSASNGAPEHRRRRGTDQTTRTSIPSSPSTQISTATTDASSTTLSGCRAFGQQNADSTTAPSSTSGRSPTSSSNTSLQALYTSIRALRPPQAILDALLAASDARDRLTIQVYHGIPPYFDLDHSGDQEFARRIRVLESVRLPGAMGLLAATQAYATMRAVRVLVNDEQSAMGIVGSWLGSLCAGAGGNLELRGFMMEVQATLRLLEEAHAILYEAREDTTAPH
ncbi:hypothetical protein LTR78_008804 [Recurvomyces mirabilis]|uniref:Uncharacterized protein n=1 Tax=Recurvomyces mirabilis TaxID=574656 RepID=A0AAE0TUD8_9PEZI|nr:hypothetical protein LTR78_008804 [Recurvomyces mirabilis]KAK5160958.1 hypothetical protein LTS14_000752 [Recurvomyces mirabilis]